MKRLSGFGHDIVSNVDDVVVCAVIDRFQS